MKILKKIVSVGIASMMLLGLAGCSDDVSDVTLQTKTVNGVSLSVPSDFGEFTSSEGYMVASGPNASLTISPATADDSTPADWTEQTIREALQSEYSSMTFKSVTKGKAPNGEQAVYASFTAKSSDTTDSTVYEVRLVMLFTDKGQLYINFIMFTEGDNSSTAKFADDIMKSMTVAK